MLLKNYVNNLSKKFSEHKFKGIAFNSKKVKKGYIFFAIKGTKLDGKNFIKEAIKKGAKTIICDNCKDGYKGKILYLRSRDVRSSLAKFANKIYKQKPKNLVAVTGTNGKTSVSIFYNQILELINRKSASIGTLGVNTPYKMIKQTNTTVDPVNLNIILNNLKRKKIDNVILEASSHGLKQKRLDFLKFDKGIFTSFSRDHLDYHKTYKDYFNSKLILFKKLIKNKSVAIVNNKIPNLQTIKKICRLKKIKLHIFGGTDFKIVKHNIKDNLQHVGFKFNSDNFVFKTNLIGSIQVYNIIMACVAASNNNADLKKIMKIIPLLKPVNGRLEEIGRIKNNSKVVLDYAHTPDALENCLKSVKDHFKNSNIFLVFGCGGNRDKQKRRIMGKIASKYCYKIYLTDDNPRYENPSEIRKEIKKGFFKNNFKEIPSRKEAISTAINDLKASDVLIVAGKGHENYQEYKKKSSFSDKGIILKNIKKKNLLLSNDLKLNILNEFFKKKTFQKQKILNLKINHNEIKKNDIFLAFKGKNTDGNKFADKAIKKGALLSLVTSFYKKRKSKRIKISSPLKFLTNYAIAIRKNFNGRVVAITGSSGKTSVKELLGSSLNSFSSTYFSKNSHNNNLGVPLSLANLKFDNRFAVFEVGMNKKGEINQLSKIIKPDVGIITNVSHAHIENFRSLNEIAKAKSEIISNINENGFIILNKDDKFYKFFKSLAYKKNLNILSVSKYKKANISLHKVYHFENFSEIEIKIFKTRKKFLIQKKNEPFILNILIVIAAMFLFINIKDIDYKTFLNFPILEGRGDFIKIKIKNKNIFLIDESYNSNPSSLDFAIENFDLRQKIKKTSKKKILLGDMLELGKFSKKLHIRAANKLNKSRIDEIFVVGKKVKYMYERIIDKKKGRVLKNVQEIENFVKERVNHNDYLMVKASNGTGINKEIKKLREKYAL